MADIFQVGAIDKRTGEPIQVRAENKSTAQRLEEVLENSEKYKGADYEKVF